MEPFALILAAVLAQSEAATQPPPPPPPGRGMMRADANGDGVITREEFLAEAAARFDRLDVDHNGRIERSEMPTRDERRGRFGGRRDRGDMPPPPPPAGGDDDDR